MLAFRGKVLFVCSQVRKQILRETRISVMNNSTVYRRFSVKFREERKEVDVRKLKPLAKSANFHPAAPKCAQTIERFVNLHARFVWSVMWSTLPSLGGWICRSKLPNCAGPKLSHPTRHETHVMRLMGRAINVRLAGLFSKLAKINSS